MTGARTARAASRTALAGSSRPQLRVTSCTPLSRRSRLITRETGHPAPLWIRRAGNMVATMTPGN
ncbi:MAG TPA: hypothetical protein VMH35_09100 [Streptosporangiaceae bacterium]|nr:hypothetical protein [Streptosporangiaceae bacterium]